MMKKHGVQEMKNNPWWHNPLPFEITMQPSPIEIELVKSSEEKDNALEKFVTVF